jgi:hypothetical protein
MALNVLDMSYDQLNEEDIQINNKIGIKRFVLNKNLSSKCFKKATNINIARAILFIKVYRGIEINKNNKEIKKQFLLLSNKL